MQPADSPKVTQTKSLYSPVAVQFFAFALMPLLGGFMAHSSLKNLGQRAAARRLLWESIFFTVAVFFATNFFSNTVVSNNMVSTGLNMAGVLWLGRRYNQLAPEASRLPHKSLTIPILIALLFLLIWAFPRIGRLYF